MAKQILFFIFASFLCMNVFSGNTKDAEKELELHNDLPTGKELRSSRDAVLITKSDSYLNLYVLVPVGNVYFEVTNEAGSLIYQNTINSSDQDVLSVEIAGWDKGNYKVIVAYSNGSNRLRGNFEIQ